jgi:putative intracellular protease/amidase
MAEILIVLTSHDRIGEKGRATGFFWEELATPYYAFLDAGHRVTLASIAGGRPPADPTSLEDDEAERPASVRRFLADGEAMAALQATPAVAEVDPAGFDAIFLPGGHGTMWDFPTSEALAEGIRRIYEAGGVVGAVCHGPAGLVAVRRADGRPLVEGLTVNGFTDAEEEKAGLTEAVPFLLETRLRDLGGRFEGGAPFTSKAVRDGRLVTGQNPMSSEAVARLILDALEERARSTAA